jgi:hypothetical protein
MAAVMSAKRPRAFTNGVNAVGSVARDSRVCSLLVLRRAVLIHLE